MGANERRGPIISVRRPALAFAVSFVVALLIAGPANAAFPGYNGKIAFFEYTSGAGYQIWTIEPNGSGRTVLFAGLEPAWSSDGQRLAFNDEPGDDIYTSRPDGSDPVNVTHRSCTESSCSISYAPSWSPDGTRLALYTVRGAAHQCCYPDMSTINADGTGAENVIAGEAYLPDWSPDGSKIAFNYADGIWATPYQSAQGATQLSADGLSPNWSPDASRIAFSRSSSQSGFGSEIWVMNADGTNKTRLTVNPVNPAGTPSDDEPAWSPDGSKIVFRRSSNSQSDLYTMNVDGTDQRNLTNTPEESESSPDWQPLSTPPATGYARPRGATPVNVWFVPAFTGCAGSSPSGMTHGPPLAVPSCQPPQPTSQYLTMGTADSNGQASNFTGELQLKSICNPPAPSVQPPCTYAGDQADLKLDAQFTDVRNVTTLTDYTGELQVKTTLRITDRVNSADGTDPATTVDVPFSFTVPCSGDLDLTVGSTCGVSTTADALNPGIVPEGKRSVWNLGQVQVYDGGADGVATTADNTLFLTQGLFAP